MSRWFVGSLDKGKKLLTWWHMHILLINSLYFVYVHMFETNQHQFEYESPEKLIHKFASSREHYRLNIANIANIADDNSVGWTVCTSQGNCLHVTREASSECRVELSTQTEEDYIRSSPSTMFVVERPAVSGYVERINWSPSTSTMSSLIGFL